jgi:hypothetical protein
VSFRMFLQRPSVRVVLHSLHVPRFSWRRHGAGVPLLSVAATYLVQMVYIMKIWKFWIWTIGLCTNALIVSNYPTSIHFANRYPHMFLLQDISFFHLPPTLSLALRIAKMTFVYELGSLRRDADGLLVWWYTSARTRPIRLGAPDVCSPPRMVLDPTPWTLTTTQFF